MNLYFIVFPYYIFVLLGFYFVLLKSSSLAEREYLRRKNSGTFIKKIINILNLITHKIGTIAGKDNKAGIGIRNKRILEILEHEEDILITLQSFLGYKILLGFLFIVGGGYFGSNLPACLAFGVIGGIIGYFVPDTLIRRSANKISADIDKELPYIIDLLRVAITSGQNIYNSFRILIEKYNGRVCFDLRNFIKDIDWGLGKDTAYGNLIERNKSKQFTDLMAVLLEAERYGSSINEILDQKSEQINFQNWENAERKARKITLFSLIPLVFLILPAFILLVGGPLIFTLGAGIFS